MLFQGLALLVAKFGRIAFDLKGALLLPCAQFKKCAGFVVLTQGLIVSGLLCTVGVQAQQATAAGISFSAAGQAPPEVDLEWQELASSSYRIFHISGYRCKWTIQSTGLCC